MGLDARKLSSEFANNKVADQPVHPRRLISAFVIHLLERTISTRATGEMSIFYLVSVSEQAGLNLTLRDRFSHVAAHIKAGHS